jgi:DNA replication and repair protein RecF
MYLKQLHLENFRNYKKVTLRFSSSGAVLYGANGSGKTNILEAVYFLCTGRSQRNASRGEMIGHDNFFARIEGTFVSYDEEKTREIHYSFNRENGSEIRIDNRKIASFSDYYGKQPVVSFSPNDIQLVYDAPEARRRFIDMLIGQMDREYLSALITYRKNLCLRNKLLKTSNDQILFSIYEQGMAESGEILCRKRAQIINELGEICTSIYNEISGGKEFFSLGYQPGFPHDNSGIKAWKNVFYTMLSERRKRDRELGFSSSGPHRDDLFLQINQKAAKTFSSQGQCRTIVLSLKLASIRILEKNSAESMIILFDDAVSELDPKRIGRVYGKIENRGQILVASPHEDGVLRDGVKRYRVADNTASAYDS